MSARWLAQGKVQKKAGAAVRRVSSRMRVFSRCNCPVIESSTYRNIPAKLPSLGGFRAVIIYANSFGRGNNDEAKLRIVVM